MFGLVLGFAKRFVASPISGYLAILFGAILVVMGISLKVQSIRLHHAQKNVAELTTSNEQLKLDVSNAVAANKTNLATIAECRSVNAFNAAQRVDVQIKANAANQRVAELQKRLETALKGDHFESHDTECRTLDQPLPADFMCWLRGGPGSSCNGD